MSQYAFLCGYWNTFLVTWKLDNCVEVLVSGLLYLLFVMNCKICMYVCLYIFEIIDFNISFFKGSASRP